MDRRSFLKVTSMAGLAVAAPTTVALAGPPRWWARPAHAADEGPYTGNFFVMVNAGGGWDPTHLCDPKGAAAVDEVGRINNFLEADIEQAGNIRYAPFPGLRAFFQAHSERLTVINGLDMQTNGHDAGNRHMWSGRLGEGFPAIPAYIAGALSPAQPMAYVSFGGYDLTQGVVARTRSGNVGALSNLAYPERRDPTDEASTFHSQAALDYIAQAQTGRQQALLDAQRLPRIRQAMSTLFTARSGSNELKKLQEFLPAELNRENPLYSQAQVAVAAYRAGISVAATLDLGGFDTHGNHDASHVPRLETLVAGVDFLWREAERQGVGDKLVVVVGSDFGRTPGYNDQNGKDHWSVTSMLLMGAGIPGNRVIGQTDSGHKPLELDPNTLQAVPAGTTGAVRLGPAHVHRALRRLAGVDTAEFANQFPLSGEDLPLFG
jgi:uncharacterized protein (DUF1501 family)